MPKVEGDERYIIYARLNKGEKAYDLAKEYEMRTYDLLKMCERIRKAKTTRKLDNAAEEKIVLSLIRKHPELRKREIARRTSISYYRVSYILKKYKFERVFVGHRCQWISADNKPLRLP